MILTKDTSKVEFLVLMLDIFENFGQCSVENKEFTTVNGRDNSIPWCQKMKCPLAEGLKLGSVCSFSRALEISTGILRKANPEEIFEAKLIRSSCD